MATIRKASSYSKRHVVPYTRVSKKKSRAYIKAVPPQKIVKFVMGKSNGFPHIINVISKIDCQIRDSALEASRQYIHKILEESFPGQFLFRVIPFPHHIQRENKMLSMAGADRLSTGMQLSFGKAIAKSAIVKVNSRIFYFELPNPRAVELVRKSLNQVRSKLPCPFRILEEKR